MLTCFILGFALGNRLADKTDVNGETQSSGKGFGMGGISGILNTVFFVLYWREITYCLYKHTYLYSV